VSAVFLVLVSSLLHAGWNTLARSLRAESIFLRVTIIVAVIGVPLALLGQSLSGLFPPPVWGILVVSACCQAFYYLGLTKGYQSGDFTVVYPLVRTLPILCLAAVDFVRGRDPAPLAWLGILLVSLGCVVLSLSSLSAPGSGSRSGGRRRRQTALWIAVTALGTVGYSIADKYAAEMISPGPASAARYQVFEYALGLVPLALLLWLAIRVFPAVSGAASPAGRGRDPGAVRDGGQLATAEDPPAPPARNKGAGSGGPATAWLWAAVAAGASFGAYWLVLWAYQLTSQASYVLAMRQLSIVFGAAAGAVLFREPAPTVRVGATLGIVAGVACIAFAG
jgi:drug/metabolite transporter (DMT)-like permease